MASAFGMDVTALLLIGIWLGRLPLDGRRSLCSKHQAPLPAANLRAS
jgi:hypothetical protein